MRLIDAEKVVHEYYKNPSYQQLCKLLNEAPTVEAIPIAWLEKEYLGEIRRAGCMPRSEVVKEIIERWRGETGE